MSLTQVFKELNTINRDKTTFSLRLDPEKKPWSCLIWPCQLDFCRSFRHISLHLNDNLMQTTYNLVVSLKETRFGLSLYN